MYRNLIPDNDKTDGEVPQHPGQEEDHVEQCHGHHNLQKVDVYSILL